MAPGTLFTFVQFEFGFMLGPADGRYLSREAGAAEAERVIVLQTLAAPQRRLLRGRRARAVERPQAEPVPTARATLVGPRPMETLDEAEAWLDSLKSDREAAALEAQRGAAELNSLLRVHRATVADPHAREVSPAQALVVRIGYGAGEEVADGRFTAAIELPKGPPPARRTELLAPQERLAAVLGGREQVMACEELVLRARADLEAGRPREAALQARIALEALLAELRDPRLAELLAEIEGDREAVAEASNAALAGDPPERLQAAVAEAVERMRSAVRRRRLSEL